ncbi:MAG: hypothetical protein RMH84_05845 [Sulfolobales archaeon]|nr:hypothetical protein [Sulfolobales archaeon]
MSYVPSVVVSNERIYGKYYLLTVKTLRRLVRTPQPPQFSMVWVPGVDLVPLSYALYEGSSATFFYKVVGDGTRNLSLKKPGDVVAISEPIGRPFTNVENPVFLVGGSGVASVIHYSRYLKNFSGMWGVKSGALAEALLERFPKLKQLHLVSEDCAVGFCGKLTDFLDRLRLDSDTTVITAGPLEMVRAVCRWTRARGIRGYVVAEAMVKCGIGACGSCTIGNLLLCKDGPAVSCDVF